MVLLDFNSDSEQEIQVDNKIYIIIQKFDSKKNNVYLVRSNDVKFPAIYVLKKFSKEFKKNLQIEKDILTKLNELNLPVPKLYQHLEDCLFIEYIRGQNIMQIINNKISNGHRLTINELNRIFEILGAWFAELHYRSINEEGMVILKGDCVLKNFIYNHKSKSTKLFGVDFEESYLGSAHNDLGAVCSVILTIKPRFSKLNYELCKIFINSYNKTLNKNSDFENKFEILKIEFGSPHLAFSTADALEFAYMWVSSSNSKEYLEWSKIIRKKRSLKCINYLEII